MNEKTYPSALNRWVAKYHWDEVVRGTLWQQESRGLRSPWRNGYMAHVDMKEIGFRLVHNSDPTKKAP